MDLLPIKTEEEYKKALARLLEVFDAPIGTPESDEADLLGDAIDEYEMKDFPWPTSDFQEK